ncbi:MAG: hypothetical protein JJE21_04260 [Spirochaetaceae bacterium]|nr:hypothetical protein [Spirochaetaceae bacterium]
MSIISAIFVSTRYWSNREELDLSILEATKTYLNFSDAVVVLEDGDISSLSKYQVNDFIIAIPFSGAVQASILECSKKFKKIVIFASYIKGILSDKLSDLLIQYNAAPTVMDSYAVLKRDNKFVKLLLNEKQLKQYIKVLEAYDYTTTANLLLIGDIEPWVVSCDRDLSVYENKLGLKINHISKQVLIDKYNSLSKDDKDFNKVKAVFVKNNTIIVEPTNKDIDKAILLTLAILALIKEYNATGLAIACFDLIKDLDTTSCLALSYINGNTDYVAACEGDVESMISMVMLKKLASSPLWMANPNLQSNEIINFAHCTSPLNMNNEGCNYILRNHHESSRGVSPQVELPINKELTMFRYGNLGQSISVQSATSIEGKREVTCRTQLTLKPNSFEYYINTTLGTHMIITYSNITGEIKQLAKLLELEIL